MPVTNSNGKKLLYWPWLRIEAAKIKSDGCSGVPDFHLDCCLQHDASYWYAKCPVSAYTYYLEDSPNPWEQATNIFESDADARFRRCIQQDSPFGRYSPMSWWRWAALKMFGKKAWNSHAETQKNASV